MHLIAGASCPGAAGGLPPWQVDTWGSAPAQAPTPGRVVSATEMMSTVALPADAPNSRQTPAPQLLTPTVLLPARTQSACDTGDRSSVKTGEAMTDHAVHSWLTDMDGVLVHDDVALPGAAEFLVALKRTERSFLVLTNNSIFTPRDLSARLVRSGIDLAEENIWTSALSTAAFMEDQAPGATVYAIGEAGLTTALHESGMILSNTEAEYVVLARPCRGRCRPSRRPST